MDRVYNFLAGPSYLPLEVLEDMRDNLLNYKGLGYSVLEMNHRSQEFYDILDDTKATLKKLMNLSDDYEFLFLQGGASLQFAMIPLNLSNKDDISYYTLSGIFSNNAYNEAKKYNRAEVLASSKDDNYNHIEKFDKNKINQNAKYVHFTFNNTAFGTCLQEVPDTGKVPIVGDLSSIILAKDYDFNKIDLIYGGIQKNIGIAGCTFVFIKKSLIKEVPDYVPTMLSYKTYADNNSVYNTPPVFAIYTMNLMAHFVERHGGIKAFEKINNEKSKMIYDILDNSNFYIPSVINKEDRSPMNITFNLPNEELIKKFIDEAKEDGMINVKGHKAAGGLRVSLYNAMPIEGVKKLANFMEKFEKINKK